MDILTMVELRFSTQEQVCLARKCGSDRPDRMYRYILGRKPMPPHWRHSCRSGLPRVWLTPHL